MTIDHGNHDDDDDDHDDDDDYQHGDGHDYYESHDHENQVPHWDVINEMVDEGAENHTFYLDHSGDPLIRWRKI